MPNFQIANIEFDMLWDRIRQHFDRKFVQREIHNAAILHAGGRTDELHRHIDPDLLIGMDDDKVDMAYPVRDRMKLHFAKNASLGPAIQHSN